MPKAQDYYPRCPETLVVAMARSGDRQAFENLVERRQSSIRGLMRRFCGDATLADDLAQQVFFRMWLKIRLLKNPLAFPAWLKRLAVNVWLQHLRKNDALRDASEFKDFELTEPPSSGVDLDLDQGLATLPPPVRMCIVLSYQEGMSHAEIAEMLDMPLGTVKSHINRGTTRLQKVLSAYRDKAATEGST